MAGSDARTGQTAFGAQGAGVDACRALTPAGYAWEFLRRNPLYRREYDHGRDARTPVDRVWGLRFFADPTTPSPNVDVYWRAEAAPAIVVTAVAAETRSIVDLDLPKPPTNARHDEDGLHLRLADDLQVFLAGRASVEGPVVVALSFDRDFRIRMEAARRLHATARSGYAPPTGLASAQRQRLERALRALDGSLNQESYRSIAEQIFGAEAVDGAGWKTTTIRDATIRLVQTGRRLMRGGYLKLLRRP